MREPYEINVPQQNINNGTSFYEAETQTTSSEREKNNLRKDIYDIVFPNLKKDIADLLKEEKILVKVSNICEIIKYVMLISVPILALSAPQFQEYNSLLSYLSGGVSIFAIGVERFGKVASVMSKQKSQKVKDILKNLNVSYIKEDLTIIAGDDVTSPRTK